MEETKFLMKVWLSVYKLAMKLKITTPADSADRAVECAKRKFFKKE